MSSDSNPNRASDNPRLRCPSPDGPVWVPWHFHGCIGPSNKNAKYRWTSGVGSDATDDACLKTLCDNVVCPDDFPAAP